MKSPAEIMDPHPETLPDGKASATGELQRRVSAKTSHVLADLLFVLTLRDIKIKYKQSVMGLLWAVLMPMIIVGAGMLIRVAMAEVSDTPLPPSHLASLCVKAVPWAFFVSGIRFATASLTTNMNLVTKINCPRIAFPVSAVLSSLFDLVVATVPLIVILVWLGITPSLMLLWVPILIGLLVLLVMGLGIALSAGNLFFRDVKYIVEVLLTFAIFFTPVLYDVDMFGDWSFWLLLNPVSPILEGLRSVIVLQAAPDPRWLAYAAIVSVAVFAAGWRLFRRLEPIFADRI
jgi:ABC-type polysaccharide/polyol phosphate export permease